MSFEGLPNPRIPRDVVDRTIDAQTAALGPGEKLPVPLDTLLRRNLAKLHLTAQRSTLPGVKALAEDLLRAATNVRPEGGRIRVQAPVANSLDAAALLRAFTQQEDLPDIANAVVYGRLNASAASRRGFIKIERSADNPGLSLPQVQTAVMRSIHVPVVVVAPQAQEQAFLLPMGDQRTLLTLLETPEANSLMLDVYEPSPPLLNQP